MSEKEYKAKCENMFARNTVLINENAELKKENEELKADKEWLDNTNNEQTKVILELQEQIEKENEQLKQQIEQLSNDNHVLKTAFITQQEQIEKMNNAIIFEKQAIENYKNKIEKMKCCGNCKHLGIYFDEEAETIQGCIYQNECHNYDKWELEDE